TVIRSIHPGSVEASYSSAARCYIVKTVGKKRWIRYRHQHRRCDLALMNGQHSGTTVNVDTQEQSIDGRACIWLDRNLFRNKCLRPRLQVGMRDHRHLAVACVEPHDVVRAVRGNSRAEE